MARDNTYWSCYRSHMYLDRGYSPQFPWEGRSGCCPVMCKIRIMEKADQQSLTLIHSLQESSILHEPDRHFWVRLYSSFGFEALDYSPVVDYLILESSQVGNTLKLIICLSIMNPRGISPLYMFPCLSPTKVSFLAIGDTSMFLT